MSARRVIDWNIIQTGDDTYDLRFQRKTIMQDVSKTEIDKRLRRDRKPGQSVHVVNKAGEVTNITRRTDRRHHPVVTAARTLHRPVRMPLIRF